MKHLWQTSGTELIVDYQWEKKSWNSFKIVAENKKIPITNGSEEEFITEHFWGYTRINNTKTSEYEVAHPTWNVYPVTNYLLAVDFADVYGAKFGFLKNQDPASVFLAEGSEIQVKHGKILTA